MMTSNPNIAATTPLVPGVGLMATLRDGMGVGVADLLASERMRSASTLSVTPWAPCSKPSSRTDRVRFGKQDHGTTAIYSGGGLRTRIEVGSS